MKKILLLTLVLTLCSVTVFAADSRAHYPQMAVTKTASVVHTDAKPPWVGLKKIFSNLGTKTDRYDATNGYFVSGIDNAFTAQKQDIAIPFIPAKDSTVVEVIMALQYYGSGFNGAQAAIYDDASGVPGKALATRDLKNFGNFGDGCCKLAYWRLKTGLKVMAGTQYWVVGTTDAKSMDSINTWDFVWNDAPGSFAFQQDDGGWILLQESDGFAPSATAVYGNIP